MHGNRIRKRILPALLLGALLSLSWRLPALAWDGTEPEAVPGTAPVFAFTDAWGVPHCAYLDTKADPCTLDYRRYWQHIGESASYAGDPAYTVRRGIDVSYKEGKIDWNAVKAAGYDFAFIRLGYRGWDYGNCRVDSRALENLQGAQAAGLDTGCYFYSQAVSIQEAIEEADLCLSVLSGFSLQLPVMYDPEFARGRSCRVDGLTKKQFTDNAVAFCNTIRNAGYDAGVYTNLNFEGFHFDVSVIQYYPVWYADYSLIPQTPYDYQFLQYSEKGTVPGIGDPCDLDLQFIPNE